MMMMEHDSAGEALRDLRRLTSDYAPPSDACISYQTLYKALADFETDLHQHIHLENNILFPRAIAMENGVSWRVDARRAFGFRSCSGRKPICFGGIALGRISILIAVMICWMVSS